jgi:hypothetical protein
MVQLSQSGGSGGGSKEDSLAGLISVLLGKTYPGSNRSQSQQHRNTSSRHHFNRLLFRIRLFDFRIRRSVFRDGSEVLEGFYLAAEHSAVCYRHRNELGERNIQRSQ